MFIKHDMPFRDAKFSPSSNTKIFNNMSFKIRVDRTHKKLRTFLLS